MVRGWMTSLLVSLCSSLAHQRKVVVAGEMAVALEAEMQKAGASMLAGLEKSWRGVLEPAERSSSSS